MVCTVPLKSFVLLAQAARNVEVQVVEDGEGAEGHAGVSYSAMQSALYWPSASTSQPGPEDRCVAFTRVACFACQVVCYVANRHMCDA